jgi:hypothetical protein
MENGPLGHGSTLRVLARMGGGDPPRSCRRFFFGVDCPNLLGVTLILLVSAGSLPVATAQRIRLASFRAISGAQGGPCRPPKRGRLANFLRRLTG